MFEFCFSAGEGKFFFLFVFIKRKFHHWKKAKRQHLRLIFGFLGFSPASQSSKRQQIEGSRKVWPLLREDQDLSEEGKKESSLKKGRLCQTHTQKKRHRIAGIKVLLRDIKFCSGRTFCSLEASNITPSLSSSFGRLDRVWVCQCGQTGVFFCWQVLRLTENKQTLGFFFSARRKSWVSSSKTVTWALQLF